MYELAGPEARNSHVLKRPLQRAGRGVGDMADRPARVSRSVLYRQPRVRPVDDIVEHVRVLVEHGVHEADAALADAEALLVDAGDERGEDGRRGRGAAREAEGAADVRRDVVAVLAGTMRLASGTVVGVWRIVVREVAGDGFGLVAVIPPSVDRLAQHHSTNDHLLGSREDVRESATAGERATIRVAGGIHDRTFRVIDGLAGVDFGGPHVGQPEDTRSARQVRGPFGWARNEPWARVRLGGREDCAVAQTAVCRSIARISADLKQPQVSWVVTVASKQGEGGNLRQYHRSPRKSTRPAVRVSETRCIAVVDNSRADPTLVRRKIWRSH
nr:hypothetical protein CFP56_65511 [Quercus suber]